MVKMLLAFILEMAVMANGSVGNIEIGKTSILTTQKKIGKN
jgi:hypothetical protein